MVSIYSVCDREVRMFFFNDTATTEIYTLSLHDALPIYTPMGRIAASSEHQHEEQDGVDDPEDHGGAHGEDRKSTRLNSSHANISYAVFCLKKKKPDRSSLYST